MVVETATRSNRPSHSHLGFDAEKIRNGPVFSSWPFRKQLHLPISTGAIECFGDFELERRRDQFR